MGALVTTLKAGMAFADWPSSDGQNMLLYPWLQDLANWNRDKFTEHGHRLAGVLIGLFSMALVGVTFRFERRLWVRRFSLLILAAVIGQGLLGGARVLLDRQVLAMLHSVTAALFFALCVLFLLLTSRSWDSLKRQQDSRLSIIGAAIVLLFPILVLGQYLLGGAFRHLHTMLDEHLAGAAVVTIAGVAAAFQLARSDSAALRMTSGGILGALGLQLVLGFSAYLTRLGLPSQGYVATPGSLMQTVVCSLHTVGGIVLLGTAVAVSAVTIQLGRIGGLQRVNEAFGRPAAVSALNSSHRGGVA